MRKPLGGFMYVSLCDGGAWAAFLDSLTLPLLIFYPIGRAIDWFCRRWKRRRRDVEAVPSTCKPWP